MKNGSPSTLSRLSSNSTRGSPKSAALLAVTSNIAQTAFIALLISFSSSGSRAAISQLHRSVA